MSDDEFKIASETQHAVDASQLATIDHQIQTAVQDVFAANQAPPPPDAPPAFEPHGGDPAPRDAYDLDPALISYLAVDQVPTDTGADGWFGASASAGDAQRAADDDAQGLAQQLRHDEEQAELARSGAAAAWSDQLPTRPDEHDAPRIGDTWPYDQRVPDNDDALQREHPFPVSLRERQTDGGYDREASRRAGEETVLVPEDFNRDLWNHYQNEITQQRLDDEIRFESDLFHAVANAYGELALGYRLEKDRDVVVSEEALFAAFASNLGAVSEQTREVADALKELGVEDADVDAAIERISRSGDGL